MITYFWTSIFICLNHWCYEEFSININHYNLDRLLKFEMGGIKGWSGKELPELREHHRGQGAWCAVWQLVGRPSHVAVNDNSRHQLPQCQHSATGHPRRYALWWTAQHDKSQRHRVGESAQECIWDGHLRHARRKWSSSDYNQKRETTLNLMALQPSPDIFWQKNYFNAKCTMHNWPSPDVFWQKNIFCLSAQCVSVCLFRHTDKQTWPPCLMGVLRTWIDFLDIRTKEHIMSVCLFRHTDKQTWPPCLMGVLRTWIDFLDIRTKEHIMSVCLFRHIDKQT